MSGKKYIGHRQKISWVAKEELEEPGKAGGKGKSFLLCSLWEKNLSFDHVEEPEFFVKNLVRCCIFIFYHIKGTVAWDF